MAFSAAFALLLGAAIICRINARKIGGGGGGGGGGRGGGGGSMKDNLRPFLLWLALILFAGAGTLAPNTFVGDIIDGVLWAIWVAWLVAFAMIIAVVRDLWHDREPDKAAPFALFLLPAVSTELGGAIGNFLKTFWANYNNIIIDALQKLTGV
jgi:hypothetical protein